MFYEEKVIDGLLCYRLDPNSTEWIPKLSKEETFKYLYDLDIKTRLQSVLDEMNGLGITWTNPFQLKLAF